jgi:tetratricopeptide (TPR) repeat protein
MAKHPPRPPISGVFSTVTVNSIGTGVTTRKTEAVTYHYVREREDGILEVQPLGEKVSFGAVREVTLDEFLEQFMPEPQMSQERARAEATRQGAVIKAVARGDKFYNRGKTYSAEFEYGKALALDEDNVRANFGVGLCYIARGDQAKAREVFERLVTLDAAFESEHKHLFNEFGIQLRISGM